MVREYIAIILRVFNFWFKISTDAKEINHQMKDYSNPLRLGSQY